MPLIEDILKSLLEKAEKNDKILGIVKDKLAELDKQLAVHGAQSKANLNQLENKINTHSDFCPINRVEVAKFVHEEVNKINFKKKEKENTYTEFFKSIPFFERLIIYGFLAYFVATKLGWL